MFIPVLSSPALIGLPSVSLRTKWDEDGGSTGKGESSTETEQASSVPYAKLGCLISRHIRLRLPHVKPFPCHAMKPLASLCL